MRTQGAINYIPQAWPGRRLGTRPKIANERLEYLKSKREELLESDRSGASADPVQAGLLEVGLKKVEDEIAGIRLRLPLPLNFSKMDFGDVPLVRIKKGKPDDKNAPIEDWYCLGQTNENTFVLLKVVDVTYNGKPAREVHLRHIVRDKHFKAGSNLDISLSGFKGADFSKMQRAIYLPRDEKEEKNWYVFGKNKDLYTLVKKDGNGYLQIKANVSPDNLLLPVKSTPQEQRKPFYVSKSLASGKLVLTREPEQTTGEPKPKRFSLWGLFTRTAAAVANIFVS